MYSECFSQIPQEKCDMSVCDRALPVSNNVKFVATLPVLGNVVLLEL